MKTNVLWAGLVIILCFAIIVLSWLLYRSSDVISSTVATTTPTVTTPTAGSSTTTTTPSAPLSKSVTITAPLSGATVSKDFMVTGSAPGNWYFEAVFPIQVRDQNNALIGTGQGVAQGNWMTTALVPFAASTTVTTNYTGPATLVLLRDNPSGLPENDDSVSIPIIIQ